MARRQWMSPWHGNRWFLEERKKGVPLLLGTVLVLYILTGLKTLPLTTTDAGSLGRCNSWHSELNSEAPAVWEHLSYPTGPPPPSVKLACGVSRRYRCTAPFFWGLVPLPRWMWDVDIRRFSPQSESRECSYERWSGRKQRSNDH